MDGRHDLAAAIERLRRHFAAKTDGESPYTGPSEHDPAMAWTFDGDQYRWDCEAVIGDYLKRHGGPEPGTCRGTEGI